MGRLFLTGAEIFDGTGTLPISGQVLVLEDAFIADLIPETSLPSEHNARSLDLTGTTVLPGLIDLHAHCSDWTRSSADSPSPARLALRAARNVRDALRGGTTSVRDMGGPYCVAQAVRDGVRDGDIQGSRVVASGHIICMTGGHGSEPPFIDTAREADGPDDCRRAVREEIKSGADVIKVATNGPMNVVEFTQPELDAVVDEAHRCGRRVACHASLLESARMAVDAGVDTIEHGCDLDEELVKQMVDRGIVLVPTLLAMQLIMERWDDYRSLPIMRSIPHRAKKHVASFQMALRAGVVIGAGTDTSPGLGGFAALPDELGRLVECGMTPTQALVAATHSAAMALDIAEPIGIIRRGATADLLACFGRPTNDIGTLKNPAAVVQGGGVVFSQVGVAVQA